MSARRRIMHLVRLWVYRVEKDTVEYSTLCYHIDSRFVYMYTASFLESKLIHTIDAVLMEAAIVN